MVPAADRQPAADDEVAGVGVVALGEHDVAGLEAHPVAQADDLGGDRPIDVEQSVIRAIVRWRSMRARARSVSRARR